MYTTNLDLLYGFSFFCSMNHKWLHLSFSLTLLASLRDNIPRIECCTVICCFCICFSPNSMTTTETVLFLETQVLFLGFRSWNEETRHGGNTRFLTTKTNLQRMSLFFSVGRIFILLSVSSVLSSDGNVVPLLQREHEGNSREQTIGFTLSRKLRHTSSKEKVICSAAVFL